MNKFVEIIRKVITVMKKKKNKILGTGEFTFEYSDQQAVDPYLDDLNSGFYDLNINKETKQIDVSPIQHILSRIVSGDKDLNQEELQIAGKRLHGTLLKIAKESFSDAYDVFIEKSLGTTWKVIDINGTIIAHIFLDNSYTPTIVVKKENYNKRVN